MIFRLILFLLLNFGALALGATFAGGGATSEWYSELNKAPWTPPGWVFGAAWTTIMICYSAFMAIVWKKVSNKKTLILIYAIQWVLNVSWNPSFFYYHWTFLGLAIIIGLAYVVGWFQFRSIPTLKYKSLLMTPYFLWLLIATSLNAYVVFMN
ncbi:MAG: tryptophan-rich sensory protein [bacterium]|nr:tryptophan-rich sensory protein [bacterium]